MVETENYSSASKNQIPPGGDNIMRRNQKKVTPSNEQVLLNNSGFGMDQNSPGSKLNITSTTNYAINNNNSFIISGTEPIIPTLQFQ